MKLIVATILPEKLVVVRDALHSIGVSRMTVIDSQGFRRQDEYFAMRKTNSDQPQTQRNVTLEIFVNEDFVERTVETISQLGRTGETGSPDDGRIFIIPTIEAITIDAGQRGQGAV